MMTHLSNSKRVLAILALSVLLVLILAPASRWLVRAQSAAIGLGTRQTNEQQRHDEARTALSYPHDYPVQLAAARLGRDWTASIPSLRTLTMRFGNNPSLYATLLRYQTDGSHIRLHRAEDYLITGKTPPSNLVPSLPPDPKALAAYDADAAAGERLDPANAYFPFMRAIGLFAAHRDTDAVAAVLRAGTKPRWNEYITDEMEGHIRLSQLAQGETGALFRAGIVAATLFPHYAGLRGVARVATYKAILAEKDGQPQHGLAIRRALMHCGDLMRVQSTSYIGSLVGMAIAAIATERPGGLPSSEDNVPVALPDDQRTAFVKKRRLAQFTAFASRLGHPADGKRAESQSAALKTVHAIFADVNGGGAGDRSVFGANMTRLVSWWLADICLFANVIWLLLFGAVSAGLARLSNVQAGLPLPRSVFQGSLTAVLLAFLIGLTVSDVLNMQEGAFFVFTLSAAVLAVVGLVAILRGSEKRQRAGQFTRALVLTGLMLGAFYLMVWWQSQGVTAFTLEWGYFCGLSSGSDGSGLPDVLHLAIPLAAATAALSACLVLLVILSIRGRIRRVPVSIAVVHGFHSLSVPIACVLFLVYGGMVVTTLAQERVMDRGLQQTIQHEGRYYASLAGVSWPGPVP